MMMVSGGAASVLFMCVSSLGMDEVDMGEERDKRVSEELMDSVVWEKPPDEEKVHTQHTQHTPTHHSISSLSSA